ncbi:MAG: prepilin-type N-terminal cleavage/methylation domain-containing protein [Anaerohalosphaera sp.]|nr:prepilin-type N-terminal cleavage/methylation domain-containing protein [Anaerohalosphaera sp.]
MINANMHNRAFTLIEVLISSVIATFIAVVAVGALRSVADARERIEQSTAVSDELRFAANIIRNDLANIFRDADMNSMKFVGALAQTVDEPPVSLTFRTTSTAKARFAAIEGDLYEVQYFIAQRDDKSVLMRRYCPVVGVEEDELTAGGILSPIAENIVGLSLLYFDGSEWVEQWPKEQQTLPGMVEVTLVAGDLEQQGPSNVTVSNFIVSFPRFSMTAKNQNVTEEGAEEAVSQIESVSENL